MFNRSLVINNLVINAKQSADGWLRQPSPCSSEDNHPLRSPSSRLINNKKLCLNMIVKNESAVIERLMKSVVQHIDCYCICDTGSTDNTIQKIESFFSAHQIPGIIIQEPFQDFGYNRTVALKACDALDVEYILLLDADMIFQVSPNMNREQFYERLKQHSEDVFHIFQGSPTFFYKNARIVKNHQGYSYWGVTHEYLDSGNNTKYGILEKHEAFIDDVGDGGCKTNKFTRDIELLEKGLLKEPNSVRYTFYLANSYKDSGQLDKAIETYKKRVNLGGWIEEIWFSLFNIGRCYKEKNDMVNAIHWWMEAYNVFQSRVENLHEIVNYYRNAGKNHLAYGFYLMANHEIAKNNHDDHLFLQKDIYDYKMDYELTIIGYYCNWMNYDLRKVCMKVINYPHVEDSIVKNVFSNYKFYAKPLEQHAVVRQSQSNESETDCKRSGLLDALKQIGSSHITTEEFKQFYSSTPSLCLRDGDKELVVNVRYVDYFINDKGGYENNGNITTKNVVAVFRQSSQNDWTKTDEFVLQYDQSVDNLYVGLEDVRIMTQNKDGEDVVMFNANRGVAHDNIKIEHGVVNFSNKTAESKILTAKNHKIQQVEKNWVMFCDAQQKMKMIYGWSPLVIGDVGKMVDDEDGNHLRSVLINEGASFSKTHEIKTPNFFRHLRGSTNGVKMGDEIWFICHAVSFEERRHYYHIMVVLDATTYAVKKYTPFFTFESKKVEYTLGFVCFDDMTEPNKDTFDEMMNNKVGNHSHQNTETVGEANRQSSVLLIGYSLMDKETKYLFVEKQTMENMMFLL